ncbi:MAG: antitoxin [Propionibacteriaceae bacterium]|nr:antitoxin [Propionibacteriaceae bacterium]
MAILYIRGVPEAVANTLKQRAAAQGQSLSAYVKAQLIQVASKPNAEVVARLHSRDRDEMATTSRILTELESARR